MDRRNDAAEWPPFIAASMFHIFLVQASGAQGVISKASSAKDTMLFETGKNAIFVERRTYFLFCQDRYCFLNPEHQKIKQFKIVQENFEIPRVFLLKMQKTRRSTGLFSYSIIAIRKQIGEKNLMKNIFCLLHD